MPFATSSCCRPGWFGRRREQSFSAGRFVARFFFFFFAVCFSLAAGDDGGGGDTLLPLVCHGVDDGGGTGVVDRGDDDRCVGYGGGPTRVICEWS